MMWVYFYGQDQSGRHFFSLELEYHIGPDDRLSSPVDETNPSLHSQCISSFIDLHFAPQVQVSIDDDDDVHCKYAPRSMFIFCLLRLFVKHGRKGLWLRYYPRLDTTVRD
jgi:hypothetical protein